MLDENDPIVFESNTFNVACALPADSEGKKSQQ